jgi:hypothetical protein
MAFNPSLPADSTLCDAAEMRAQLNALKALIDAQAAQLTTQAALVTAQGVQLSAQAAQITGIFPIGCTVGYFKNLASVPALPGTWVECNGQTIADVDSPLNGVVTPDTNGAGGPQRFLRGAAVSGGTGGAEAHQHGLNYAVAVSSGADAFAATSNADVSDAAASLPSYYEVVWVMRIK